MKCPYCGSELHDDKSEIYYCPNCGGKLEKKIYNDDFVSQAESPQDMPVQPLDEHNNNGQWKKFNKKTDRLIKGAAVFVPALLVVLLFFILGNWNKKNDKPNIVGNSSLESSEDYIDQSTMGESSGENANEDPVYKSYDIDFQKRMSGLGMSEDRAWVIYSKLTYNSEIEYHYAVIDQKGKIIFSLSPERLRQIFPNEEGKISFSTSRYSNGYSVMVLDNRRFCIFDKDGTLCYTSPYEENDKVYYIGQIGKNFVALENRTGVYKNENVVYCMDHSGKKVSGEADGSWLLPVESANFQNMELYELVPGFYGIGIKKTNEKSLYASAKVLYNPQNNLIVHFDQTIDSIFYGIPIKKMLLGYPDMPVESIFKRLFSDDKSIGELYSDEIITKIHSEEESSGEISNVSNGVYGRRMNQGRGRGYTGFYDFNRNFVTRLPDFPESVTYIEDPWFDGKMIQIRIYGTDGKGYMGIWKTDGSWAVEPFLIKNQAGDELTEICSMNGYIFCDTGTEYIVITPKGQRLPLHDADLSEMGEDFNLDSFDTGNSEYNIQISDGWIFVTGDHEYGGYFRSLDGKKSIDGLYIYPDSSIE